MSGVIVLCVDKRGEVEALVGSGLPDNQVLGDHVYTEPLVFFFCLCSFCC